MNCLKTLHRPWLALFALLLIAIPVMLLGADPAGGNGDADKLKAILGSDAAAWAVAGADYSLSTYNDQPTLLTKSVGSYVSITGKTRYTGPTEYRITLRMHPAKPYGSSFSVGVGCTDLPDKSKQAFNAVVSAGVATDYIGYGMSLLPEPDKTDMANKAINGTLYMKAVTERSLGWSEDMRKIIEAQMVDTPKVGELLYTLRLVVTPKSYSAWFNDRFIGRYALKEGVVPDGTVNMVMYYGPELVSFRAFPYQESSQRYVPVNLKSLLNASALVDGQPLAKKLVDKVDQEITFDNTTFRFPSPDAKGRDHLDLSPSWMRFGALTGYITANYGAFVGGRWVSADHMDPVRFCTYVPYAPYKALHLIAAFDGVKDRVPIVTAQFYRPDAGHPMNFAGKAPAFTAKSGGVKAFPVTLSNGKHGNLYHVIIPIDPDKMAWFSDLQRVGLELTKEVQPFRAYPDPCEYSWHGAGLPSGVQIFAATLEKAKVEVDPQPDTLAHVWTAPAMPGYTINLKNNTGAATIAKLTITTASNDGLDKTSQQQTVSLPASDSVVPIKVTLKPTRYGLQHLTVTCANGGETNSYARDFAFLHPDTRERGDWAEGKGPIFGFWAWGGGHVTPDSKTELTVMSEAGSETSLYSFESQKPEILELAKKLKYISHAGFNTYSAYYNAWAFDLAGKYDAKNPEATQKLLIEKLKSCKIEPSELNIPEYMTFFPEPQVGRITSGIWPSHYGVKDFQLPKDDEEFFQNFLEKFLLDARAVKKEWPNIKILLPYGDPMNTALFMRKSPEARELIDGCALDLPAFERLPEAQIDQVVLNRLYPIFQDIRQYKKNPYFVMIEGFSVSSQDTDMTQANFANICSRDFLTLIGYGVNNFESANAPFDCAGYWGEDHYGGGYCTRLPLAMPKMAYVSYATLSRHLNRRNFVKYVPTGSTSVYCQQYKHYQTGQLGYVLWTIRGKRPVSVKVPAGAQVEVYDENDNPTVLKEKNGAVTFTISPSPVYLEKMTGEADITLGAADLSDSTPAKTRTKLTNLGNGQWTLVAKHDQQYEDTNHMQIERFLGNMSAQSVAVPKAQGGTALAVHLGKQEIDRRVMPYYTTFEPKAPIVIPGKASHLGIWVKAASDWGRVIYSLRDAKGERWLSVGTKEDWNSDDIYNWSSFNFDGWRYLRFELPASAPYDCFRELGTTNWGSYEGDGIVDLPLKLDKIIVERRSSVIAGNDLLPAKPDDVLLGDLFAEYASPADQIAEAVRLNKLRMPVPAGTPRLDNPIAEMAKTGVGVPTQVLKVEDPAHEPNGTHCLVHFTPVDGAKSYDIWVSPYADGRGAMKLAEGWTQSGQQLEGLAPDIDFYLFVVYTDKDGKLSLPSKPLQIRLKNRFLYQ